MNLRSRSPQDHCLQHLDLMLTERASEEDHRQDSTWHAVFRGKDDATFQHTPMVITTQ